MAGISRPSDARRALIFWGHFDNSPSFLPLPFSPSRAPHRRSSYARWWTPPKAAKTPQRGYPRGCTPTALSTPCGWRVRLRTCNSSVSPLLAGGSAKCAVFSYLVLDCRGCFSETCVVLSGCCWQTWFAVTWFAVWALLHGSRSS